MKQKSRFFHFKKFILRVAGCCIWNKYLSSVRKQSQTSRPQSPYAAGHALELCREDQEVVSTLFKWLSRGLSFFSFHQNYLPPLQIQIWAWQSKIGMQSSVFLSILTPFSSSRHHLCEKMQAYCHFSYFISFLFHKEARFCLVGMASFTHSRTLWSNSFKLNS